MTKTDVIKSDIKSMINRYNCASQCMGNDEEVTDYECGHNGALEDVIRLLCRDMGLDLAITFRKGKYRVYKVFEIAE